MCDTNGCKGNTLSHLGNDEFVLVISHHKNSARRNSTAIVLELNPDSCEQLLIAMLHHLFTWSHHAHTIGAGLPDETAWYCFRDNKGRIFEDNQSGVYPLYRLTTRLCASDAPLTIELAC